MNKQEIENSIEAIKLLYDYNVYGIKERHVRTALECMAQQLNNGWIPVSSGNLPKCEERVFICSDHKRFDGKVIQIRTTAMYEDGTMHTEQSGFTWEDHEFEYDEEADDYIIPEGWHEQNIYCEVFGIVDDFVTHWMPMPELPEKEAL